MRIIKPSEDVWDAAGVYDKTREQTQEDVNAALAQQISGKYALPPNGIPSTDMAEAVQTALGKAGTALQEVPDSYRTAAAQDEIDDAQDAEITDVKSAIAPLYPRQAVNPCLTFTKGYLDPDTGAGSGSTTSKYCRSDWLDCRDKSYTLVTKEGNAIRVYYYRTPDLNSFEEASAWVTDPITLKTGFFVRLAAGLVSGNSMTVTEAIRSFTAYQDVFTDPDKDILKALCNYDAEAIPFRIRNNKAINALTGAVIENVNMCACTTYVDVSSFDYILFSNVHYDTGTNTAGIAFYSDALENPEEAFVSGVPWDVSAEIAGYKTRVVRVPDGAKYAGFTLLKAGDGFTLKGLRKKPLAGLYLSLLGDSMSAADGTTPGGSLASSAGNYVPANNDLYYTNSNKDKNGVSNISEIWWMRLCNETGMIPLVIDAWSGSSICYNYAQNDSVHDDAKKIPMCSALRTGRLHKNNHDPDIIIIAGGGNDWSYAANASGSYRATTPIGDWNGHTPVNPTAIDGGDSTFMESYAYMIKRLRTNYPNAIIVASTVWRVVGRGATVPAEPTETEVGLMRLNAVGNGTPDYSAAIERVCKIMDVPLVNVSDIGITEENAYPTYVQDSQERPTHTNWLGQAIIAKRYIEELPRLVKQFK